MEIRRYKRHGAVGPSSWETGTTVEFLDAIPEVCSYLRRYGLIPPLPVLNEILAIGKDDAGMSGGCEWRPFKMTSEEYSAVEEELLTSPRFFVTVDEELRSCQTLAEWRERTNQKYSSTFPQQRTRRVGPFLFAVRENTDKKG